MKYRDSGVDIEKAKRAKSDMLGHVRSTWTPEVLSGPGAFGGMYALAGYRDPVLVRFHHERPDGKGYPEGLKGDEIPVGSRILLCADAFDAMTSDRPYRKGLGLEKVVEQFEKHRGSQFDLDVSNLLIKLIRRNEFPLIVETDPTTAIYDSLKERL